MSIKFELNQPINIDDYELELNFEMLDVDNVFINMIKYMQIETNQIIFLKEDKKILGVINFENEEKAVNFFNFITFMTDYKVILKDKFAIKDN